MEHVLTFSGLKTFLQSLRDRVDDRVSSTSVNPVQNQAIQGAFSNIVSANFDESVEYVEGSYCLKDDKLYKFTETKPAGEWDDDVVTEVNAMDELYLDEYKEERPFLFAGVSVTYFDLLAENWQYESSSGMYVYYIDANVIETDLYHWWLKPANGLYLTDTDITYMKMLRGMQCLNLQIKFYAEEAVPEDIVIAVEGISDEAAGYAQVLLGDSEGNVLASSEGDGIATDEDFYYHPELQEDYDTSKLEEE